jgi:hypothetical protein
MSQEMASVFFMRAREAVRPEALDDAWGSTNYPMNKAKHDGFINQRSESG